MDREISRATFLRLAAAAGIGLPVAGVVSACGGGGDSSGAGPAGESGAANQTVPSSVTLGVFAGDLATVQRAVWAPAIESKYDTQVTLDDSFVSSKALAALEAQSGNSPLTLVVMDEPTLAQARAEDLLEPIDVNALSQKDAIPDWVLLEDGHGLGFALSYMSMLYNDNVVETPASWLDLLEPDYKGKVVIPSPALTSSLYFLVLGGLAAMNKTVPASGSLDDIESVVDSGLDFLAELKPQIAAINSDDLATFARLASGDVGIVAPSLSKYAVPYTAKGIDLRVAFPTEGVFIYANSMVIPKGSPAGVQAASGMLDLLLSPEYQRKQATDAYVGPVSQEVTLTDAQLELMPAAGAIPEGAATQATLDFDLIRERRDDWQKRAEQVLG